MTDTVPHQEIIRTILASDRPRALRRLSTASLWSRTSHRECWGGNLPSPASILSSSDLSTAADFPDQDRIQNANTAADHQLRIARLMRAIKRGEVLDPLIIGRDGLLWNGMHRLAALYACDVPEVDVLDFSEGHSSLLQPPISLDQVISPSLRETNAKADIHHRFAHAQPYRHVFISEVFAATFVETMAQELEGLDWRLSVTDFYEQYEVSLIDTERLFNNTSLDSLREVAMSPDFRDLISSLTGHEHLRVVDVACHRSMAGQQIGTHNDFTPGGEVCRLTIHLNRNWLFSDGGLFVTFASADSVESGSYLPAINTAILFEISPTSFHAVTEVTSVRPRYSIVISFCRGN